MEVIEGLEVAIATLLEKMSICEFYADIYAGALLPSQSTANSQQLQSIRDSALPQLYAAVIVFAVKARTYFEAGSTYASYELQYNVIQIMLNRKSGITKFATTFDEFQPFIEEINTKEGVIRECADAATMDRIKSIILLVMLNKIGQNLTQACRH